MNPFQIFISLLAATFLGMALNQNLNDRLNSADQASTSRGTGRKCSHQQNKTNEQSTFSLTQLTPLLNLTGTPGVVLILFLRNSAKANADAKANAEAVANAVVAINNSVSNSYSNRLLTTSNYYKR